MHFKNVKSILSSKNGMNLFRGCTHGCIYCDSRSDCYHMDHLFEDVLVKENGLALLETELLRKRKKCMISTGAMTDPYIAAEMDIRVTRRAIEIIERLGFGLSIQTKSDRILRDLDLFKRISQKTKCVVQMTLTTYDDDLCAILEPNVSRTSERLSVLRTMRDEGIETVVWLSPLLPWINDTLDNVTNILNACIEAKVKGMIWFGAGMTLRDGNRAYYYQKLDEHFPGLRSRYEQRFGNRYVIMSENHEALDKLVREKCEAHGIMHDPNEIFAYMATFPEKHPYQQLSMDL